MADTLRDLAYGAALRGQVPAQPLRLPDTIQRLAMQQPRPMPGPMTDPGYGARPDGSRKGRGFLGPLTNARGDTMTEYSVGVNIGGKQMDVPTLVPTLSPQEVRSLLAMTENSRLPDSIVQKAADHAATRLKQGQPVFATGSEERASPLYNLRDLPYQPEGTIGPPHRTTLADMVGRGGTMAQRLAQALDQYGANIPGTQKRITLKDLTLGDAGQVLEDWSYGSPPTTGGNYATGGVGTIGIDPQAIELLNLGGIGAAGGKAASRLAALR